MKFKLLLAIILTLAVFYISGTALAMTEQERQTLIAQIQAQIAQLMQQLTQLQSQQQGTTIPTPTDWCHAFNIDLDTGSTGSEVVALQTAFQKQGFTISALEIQNQQFGATTGQAVKDFKQKYSSQIITSGTTKAGEITRGILNQLYSCTTETACAQDAKQCPDGSYVSRVAPNCEFASCPTTITCAPNWQCGAWSSCANNQQTRTCTDTGYCGTTTDKPVETQFCISTPLCTAGNWKYTLSPSTCPSSGTQTKTWSTIGICSGGVSHPVRQSVSCNYRIPTCTSFTYSNWSTCIQSGIKTRTVYSSVPSGCTGGSPITSQVCTYVCTSKWSCGLWSACVNGKQTRKCSLPVGACYNPSIAKPLETQSCTSTSTPPPLPTPTPAPACAPNWQCGSWSSCEFSQQTRTCTDSNNCSTNTGKPAVSQTCANLGGKWAACQNVNIPGLTFSCISGIAPYGISGDFIINNEQFLSWQNTFGAQYTSQYDSLRNCGCSWIADPSGTIFTKLNCTTGPQCDPNKVPNKLTPGLFVDYCSFSSTPDLVQWSSRISKGESIQQALQNTINDNKINIMIGYEKRCVREKIYYIGGYAHSPNWMCWGDKYRINPNSLATDWQKWVNGAWTSNFGWNSTYTCQ